MSNGNTVIAHKHCKRALLTIFLRKPACLEECNFTLGIQVFLVADENDNDVWTGQRPSIDQPIC